MMNSHFPGRVYLLFLLIVAGAGATTILYSDSRYGPALSNDSVQYISIARNLVTDGKFESYLHGPITKWPPLYPLILAFISQVFGVDALQAAGYLNAFSFSILIASTGYLAAIILGYPYYLAALSTTLVASSVVLIRISVFAWTESLYIALSLLFLGGLHAYLLQDQARWLALMIISTALACLTRYIGFTLIIAGIVCLLLFQRCSLRRRIKTVVLFAFGSFLPLGMWLIRNYTIANSLAGNRTIASDVFVNLRLTATIIAGWYEPGGVTFLSALLGVVLGTIIGLRFDKSPRLSLAPWREMGFVIIFTLSYLIGLLISSITLSYVDDKYLSPIFVPMIILILYLVKRILMSLTQQKLKLAASVIIFSGGSIFLLTSINNVVSVTKYHINYGAGGLNQKGWQESKTIAFLRANPQLADRTIFTNSPDAVYYLANFNSRYLPDRRYYSDQLIELTGQWPSEESYLVWFNNINRTWMFTADDLLTIVEVSDEIRFNDGAIYVISRGSNQIYERTFDIPQPKMSTDFHWGDKISLLGYELLRSPSDAGVISIQVFWQALEEMERSYSVFFHVINPATGELVAQSDVIPRGWSYPTNQWAKGEIIDDIVQVPLSGLSPGRYSLYIGWYDSETGERLSVTAENEKEFEDNSAFLTVLEK